MTEKMEKPINLKIHKTCPNKGKVLKKYHNEEQIRAEWERRRKGGDNNE